MKAGPDWVGDEVGQCEATACDAPARYQYNDGRSLGTWGRLCGVVASRGLSGRSMVADQVVFCVRSRRDAL